MNEEESDNSERSDLIKIILNEEADIMNSMNLNEGRPYYVGESQQGDNYQNNQSSII